ncbi:hypothetical protein [Glycomyces buryatensis]|uniref:Uncharacterized protein n=1 Tax=Glycomyces buryatensis TaxID=2570927 RepID=A0A4S8QEK2_9ACTN|nr:hypothetical protein [Glycomyces buryatensis]THV39649.1 hypothetical protein FAB82_17420 [Glycomyces buryatensis]
MADPGAPLGEFEREDFVFTVYPDGEVHRVEARRGNFPMGLICHVYHYAYSEWYSNWSRDSWKPWIDQQARQVIAKAEQAENDRAESVAAQLDHISE